MLGVSYEPTSAKVCRTLGILSLGLSIFYAMYHAICY